MPRKVVTLGLVSLLIFQEGRVFAQTNDVQELEAVLRDMSGEVERFAANMVTADWDWSQRTDEEVEVARLRARIRNLPSGAKITVNVKGGERFEGELAEGDADEFTLWTDVDSRSGKVKKRLQYRDIEAATLPEWNGWMAPERLHDLNTDQKLELLLTTGTKAKGRLSTISDRQVVLREGADERQVFDIDDVASVRKLGMSGTAKTLIVVGAIVATLAILGATRAFCSGNQC